MLAPDLRERVDQFYVDRGSQPRIQTFWTDPERKVFEIDVLTGWRNAGDWEYPFEATFRQSFDRQQAVLSIHVERRLKGISEAMAQEVERTVEETGLRAAIVDGTFSSFQVAGLDALFASAGADKTWWFEPKNQYRFRVLERVHGWIEGICLWAPDQVVMLLQSVARKMVEIVLFPKERQALVAALGDETEIQPDTEPETIVPAVVAPSQAADSETPDLASTVANLNGPVRAVVFLGHGHSDDWKKVWTYLKTKLKVEVVVFEEEHTTGHHIVQLLYGFTEKANCAIIMVTVDDVTHDAQRRPRQNVVHEIGFFQGRLGFERVAIVQEHGVEGFSNIAGLQEIRYTPGRVGKTYEDIRRWILELGFDVG